MRKKTNKLLYDYLVSRSEEAFIELFSYKEPLIYRIIKKYVPNVDKDSFEDYVSVGKVALATMIESFTIEQIHYNTFSRLLHFKIRDEILEYANKEKKVSESIVSFSDYTDDSKKKRFVDVLVNEDEDDVIIEENRFREYKIKRMKEILADLPVKEKMILCYYLRLNSEKGEKITRDEMARRCNLHRYDINNILHKNSIKLPKLLKEFEKEYASIKKEEEMKNNSNKR